MDFPYSEFQGLVFRTLEVLEEAKEDTVIQETGKKLLATLYSRIVGTDNLELKQRHIHINLLNILLHIK